MTRQGLLASCAVRMLICKEFRSSHYEYIYKVNYPFIYKKIEKKLLGLRKNIVTDF